mmetsp:Transcript_6984/g.10234  ORF Transcript_6984/g.10234 Transcript_6984/m.10234 type:complete len:407 (+) Transcript_6984:90-1310(+)
MEDYEFRQRTIRPTRDDHDDENESHERSHLSGKSFTKKTELGDPTVYICIMFCSIGIIIVGFIYFVYSIIAGAHQRENAPLPAPIARIHHSLPSVRKMRPSPVVNYPSIPSTSYDLVIGINTLPRSSSTLSRTLSSLKQELNAVSLKSFKILVLVHALPLPSSKTHDEFSKFASSNAHDTRFVFASISPSDRFWDPFEEDPDLDYDYSVIPHPSERQHNCDIISLSTIAFKHVKKFRFFMFLEDDYVSCPGSFSTIASLLLSPTSDFNLKQVRSRACAYRFSYGFSGLVLPHRDLLHFIHYLESNIDRKRVDRLIHDYLYEPIDDPHATFCPLRSAPTQQYAFTYKENLFHHINTHSHFSHREDSHSHDFSPCRASMDHSVSELTSPQRFSLSCKGQSFSPCSFFK